VTISPSVGNVALNGTASVSPTSTTTYTITATNATGQTATANAVVNVSNVPPTITSFTANPSSVNSGGSSVLTCNTSNATSVTITGTGVSGGTGTSSATSTVTPSATTTYTCTAKGAGGTATQTTTVTVNNGGAASITSFTATPGTIDAGGSSVLACSSQNTTALTITGGSVSNVTGTTSATTTVTPSATTTYTCTGTGPNGNVTKQVTVTVNTGAPVINVAGGPVIIAYTPSLVIDLTGTVSPTGAYPITYTTVSADNIGSVSNGNTATPNLFFPADAHRTYQFRITATDAKGKQSTYLLTIDYEGAIGATSKQRKQ
jgi:hypothetical protein